MGDLSFGNWLKRRRRGLGLTQNELARRAGYAGETLRKVEADALRPSHQMAEQLAEQLAISPDERAAFIRFARDEPEADDALPPFLMALARPRSSLPIPPSLLIGRETEPAALRQLLLGAAVRLVSLLGPPGIGKTRLALHTAALLEEEFAEGVCFVPLAALEEPSLVGAELAQALGVREAGGQTLIEGLKRFLRERHMLLVLDNFEHVLPAAALVAELLAACPNVKFLVTSRAALHLAGEHEFEVPALALPALNPLPALETLAGCAAVALYVQRTQAIKPGFRLTEANAPAVAEVCVRLDGLPLAIELAAARGKLFSPAALLERLAQHDRLALLTGDARDRPARQQTLRATIDWSYNLLQPATQALLARLGVFAGGCSLAAAEAVCGGAPTVADGEQGEGDDYVPASMAAERLKLDEGLGALIDQSLVRQSEGADGEPRFWMLETLREFALERLARSGEAETLRRSHAAYYLALAERITVETRGAERGREWDQLAAEHDNFRAALAWSLMAAERVQLGLRLAKRLGDFWFHRSYYAEGQKWLAELLSRSQDVRSADRVECLILASNLMWRKYNYEQELLLAQEAVALARHLGRPREISYALNRLTLPLVIRGQFAAARALVEDSLALAREAGEVGAETGALRELGNLARNEGNFVAASEYASQALALALKNGNHSIEANTYYALGLDAWLQGRYVQAVEHFNRNSALCEAVGDQHQMGVAQWGLGCVALDQGQLALATEHFHRCLGLFRQCEFRLGFCGYLLGMAGIATARRQATAAVRLTAAAHALRASLGHRLDPCLVPRGERQLARARAQLDETTFAAAWAAGQALTVEQAVVEALAQEVTVN